MSRLDITFCDSDCKNKECERNQSKIPRGFCVTCVNFSKDCENYKRMTNGDKIRSMSDTDLSGFFDKVLDQERDDWLPIGCYNCINYNTHHYNEKECGDCKWFGGIEQWLKSEAE